MSSADQIVQILKDNPNASMSVGVAAVCYAASHCRAYAKSVGIKLLDIIKGKKGAASSGSSVDDLGRASNSYFTRTAEFLAPRRGTGNRYTVHQQDIDPDLYVPHLGKTNRELMKNGNAPYVKRSDGLERIELHHSRQNSQGPLYELSEEAHKAKTGQGREALHPYTTKRGREANGAGSGPNQNQHPDYPVDRRKFDVDRESYWLERIRLIDEGAN